MYGYLVQTGYMGLVNGEWILFATEGEYKEYLSDTDEYKQFVNN